MLTAPQMGFQLVKELGITKGKIGITKGKLIGEPNGVMLERIVDSEMAK